MLNLNKCILHPCEREAVDNILREIAYRSRDWTRCTTEHKELIALKLMALSPMAFKYLVSRLQETCAKDIVEWVLQARMSLSSGGN